MQPEASTRDIIERIAEWDIENAFNIDAHRHRCCRCGESDQREDVVERSGLAVRHVEVLLLVSVFGRTDKLVGSLFQCGRQRLDRPDRRSHLPELDEADLVTTQLCVASKLLL